MGIGTDEMGFLGSQPQEEEGEEEEEARKERGGGFRK